MNIQISPNFVAVDVEYANSRQHICQIGVAVVHNFEIISNRSWLIRPEDNEYDEGMIQVHHITPDMTENEPSMEDLWPEIQPCLLSGQLWAHNASTEQNAFQKSFIPYCMQADWLTFFDSRDLYQRPDCPPNSGNTLQLCCMAQGIEFNDTKYHDAEYDALKCAEIIIAAARGQRPDWSRVPRNSEELRKHQQSKRVLRLGEFTQYYAEHPSGEEDTFAVLSSTGSTIEQVIDVFDKGDRTSAGNTTSVDFARLDTSDSNPLYDKRVVVTGMFSLNRKDIEKAVEVMGGKLVAKPARNTDVVIIGTRNVGPNKLTAIEKQEAAEHHIVRVVGDDVKTLLYGDGQKFFE